MEKKHVWPYILLGLLIFNAILFGSLLGLGLAQTVNTINIENFTDFENALPTRLLDVNGELITEYASDEKREMIQIKDIPQIMIDALITREDRIFYQHKGFSAKALTRAVVGVVTKTSLGGGSTLTQQIAGTIYCNRSDMTISRKIKELWWAIQMERRYSKDEILEMYLNKAYLGGGTYGVNAASKYYFGHGAEEITPAEAAILVIQLSNPAYYNPFEHPNRAMERQNDVLDSMVNLGYITKAEREESFDDYWAGFDYTRTNSSAYDLRQDEAPWFSEYVRRELSDMLYGTDDIYTSGYTVNTSLNLTHQRAAEEIMKDYIAYANTAYQSQLNTRQTETFKKYVPMSELLSLLFGAPQVKVDQQRSQINTLKYYTDTLNPVLDLVSMICGMDSFKAEVVAKGNTLIKQNNEKTTIEGTMIALENSTGRIDALVGGSKYDSDNQFIRAVQARIQPGSTFKPLYYSAGIDSRKFTWSTVISDTPVVFYKQDGTAYIPQDFKGEYEGNVQLWYALAHSMNIPSLKLLDSIGFDAAITRASTLLGIPQEELASRGFEPVYPIGLGVCSVRPIEMAKAYATYANQGKEVTPIAILSIQDKDGNIIKNPERELREQQRARGDSIQLVSKQTSFIMTELLKRTVSTGTLRYGSDYNSTKDTIGKNKGKGSKFVFTNSNGDEFTMPAAGKTGTTQNWADAWTVGFTPYYTAAFWFGFDKPGQSLGLRITGSTLAGVAWADYMHEANLGKAYKDFFWEMPEGVVKLQVCSVSGDLRTPDCGDHWITAYYLEGTEPLTECTYHTDNSAKALSVERIHKAQLATGLTFNELDEDTGLTINWDAINGKIWETPDSNLYDNEGEFDLDSFLDYINGVPDAEENNDNGGNWLFD